MEALKLLDGHVEKCKTVYLRRQPNPRKKILVTEALEPPNPKCYVCADKPEVQVKLNFETFTVKSFEERILKGALNMVAPDAEIEGKGLILISSEEGETECNNEKFLKDFGLVDGSVLLCDDFLQNYNLKVYLWHADIVEVLSTANGTGDKKRPAEDGEENGIAKKPRVDGDDIMICEEKSAEKSAEELKKSLLAAQPEEGVVCIE